MSVTVDDEPLATEKMGLLTVGEVLSHLRKDNRLITTLLIDGHQPDLDRIGLIRQSPLSGHMVYIETAEPRKMALDVLSEVQQQLCETDQIRLEAVELFQQNQPERAMEKLGRCFGIWQVAQESMLKIARLLRLDLQTVFVNRRPLTDVLLEFANQLRQIKTALENRDFVTLSDILTYEAPQTSHHWRDVLDAIRDVIRAD